jgi:hypothetical protein
MLIFVVSKLVRRRARLSFSESYILTVLLIWVATIVYTGADHFSELRFFVYMLPFVYLFVFDEIWQLTEAAAGRISRLFRSSRRAAPRTIMITALSIATFLALFYYESMGVESTRRFGRHLAESWGLLGRWLQMNTEPGDVVATPVVGAIGYYCDRSIVDMLGIVDEEIAHGSTARPGSGPKDHDRYNSEYVLAKRPRYIFLMSFAPNEATFLKERSWLPAIQDLKRHFPNETYEYTVVRIGPHRYALYRLVGIL